MRGGGEYPQTRFYQKTGAPLTDKIRKLVFDVLPKADLLSFIKQHVIILNDKDVNVDDIDESFHAPPSVTSQMEPVIESQVVFVWVSSHSQSFTEEGSWGSCHPNCVPGCQLVSSYTASVPYC